MGLSPGHRCDGWYKWSSFKAIGMAQNDKAGKDPALGMIYFSILVIC